MRTSLRALGLVTLYLFSAASAGSVLAWLLVDVLAYDYVKILSRGVLLFAALGLVPLWRAAGLTAQSIGLSPAQPRHMAAAYPVGVALVLPLILFFMVVQFRVLDDRVDYAGLEIWQFVVVALFSSLLVGLFEETLFRGVLFSVLRRAAGFGLSASVVGFLYAAVHFLARDGSVPGEVAWYTGYSYVLSAFTGLSQPGGFWDGFLSLFLLGLLFCWVREKLGLWWCIGLHAAWVFAIRLFKELTVRDIYNPYQVLVSSYDNFVGHLVSIWLIFLFVLAALYRRAKVR